MHFWCLKRCTNVCVRVSRAFNCVHCAALHTESRAIAVQLLPDHLEFERGYVLKMHYLFIVELLLLAIFFAASFLCIILTSFCCILLVVILLQTKYTYRHLYINQLDLNDFWMHYTSSCSYGHSIQHKFFSVDYFTFFKCRYNFYSKPRLRVISLLVSRVQFHHQRVARVFVGFARGDVDETMKKGQFNLFRTSMTYCAIKIRECNAHLSGD